MSSAIKVRSSRKKRNQPSSERASPKRFVPPLEIAAGKGFLILATAIAGVLMALAHKIMQ
jgi:hypothetical protein